MSDINLLTIQEAAARYKCHPRTIRRLIDAGEIDVYRVGPKLVRIDAVEVDHLFLEPKARTA